MFGKRPQLTVWLAGAAWMLAAAAGCGGGGRAEGPSLREQYEQAMKIPAAEIRADRLVAIAAQQIAGNNEIGADKTLEAAALAAKMIDDPSHRAQIYLKMFGLRVKTDQAVIFREFLKEASAAVEQVEQPELQYGYLLRLAKAYARDLDKPTSAESSLAEAEALLEQLPEAERLGATIQLAGAVSAMGDADRSRQLLESSLDAARQLEDLRRRSDALGEAASLLLSLDRGDEAQPLLDEALESAAGIEDAQGRAHAFLSLARKLMLGGQGARAGGLLRQAHSAAEEIGDPTMRNSIMEEIDATRRLLQA